MTISSFLAGLAHLPRQNWLGPHFWYDTIRLARKGWPILARAVFLVIVLVSMLAMNRTQGDAVAYSKPAEFAWRANNFALLLIVLQNLLILAILPVYVATAIVEEKENQTLEALTLTHLTDRELVLGKLGARALHIGSFALVNVPLLAFMHLWGNVGVTMLIYHQLHVFLLLLSAGSVCMWASAHSESAFQAISLSYLWVAVMGLPSLLLTCVIPWKLAELSESGQPNYWIPLLMFPVAHIAVARHFLLVTIRQIEVLRHQERRLPRKLTGALTLTDDRPMPTKTGKRGKTKSRINPLAWPIGSNAVFWKECLKDGTTYSLSASWLLIGIAIVAVPSGLFRLWRAFAPPENVELALAVTLCITLSSYLMCLAAYSIVTLFQLTMSVAGEREQGTLIFLLMLPVERRAIFVAKWIGPWWRNWPILAACYLGVGVGYGGGLYGATGALVLALLPLPFLLMLGSAAFWLSVVCRRVQFANIGVIALLGCLALAHIAWGEPVLHAMSYHLALASNTHITSWITSANESEAKLAAMGQQAVFLAAAGIFLAHAYWVFRKKDYSSS